RNFGMKMLTMTNLSTECLIQLTKLGYDATPFNQILKQNAKREMRLRLGKVTVADVLAAQPVTTNLLKFMRASIKMIGVRSEERRVGKECRCWWSPCHYKNKIGRGCTQALTAARLVQEVHETTYRD